MESWAVVTIVLGTNAITSLLTWFLTNRQLTHSDTRFERQLEAQREAERHNRRWSVRSEPLLKLREELARMAEKLEGMVDLAIQVVDGVSVTPGTTAKELEKAARGWQAYFEGGSFYQAVHMQYDHGVKAEAYRISLDYQSAYSGLMAYWRGGNGAERLREAREIVQRNARRISTLQSRIHEQLEEL